MSKPFWDLFEGFSYAYGSDAGGCVWEEVTDDLLKRHRSGEEMIGVYPMVYDPEETLPAGSGGWQDVDGHKIYPDMKPELWKCMWGAIDIDEGDDSLIYAQNVATVLQALAMQGWVELSRSKGCHVWVFVEDWVEAPTMRRALQAVCQMADIKYDAVYPKQDSLPGPPGNYMRLPYGGARPEGRQEMLDDNGYPIDYYNFVIDAERSRVKIDLLEIAAALWVDPTPDLPPARVYSREPLMKIDGTRLRGVARRMYDDGPHSYYTQSHGAGRGRHGFLNRFARAMWEAGYGATDILVWTKDLDSRLGTWWAEGPKFAGRQDCDRQVERLVTNAQQRATVH